MRRRPGTILTGALLLALAACTSGSPDRAAPPPSTPAGTPSAPAAAGGALPESAWKPCESTAQQVLGHPLAGYSLACADIPVPQDWHHPDSGKTYWIALIRVRSTTQTDRIGSVVINPGGPGGSGVQEAVGLATELPPAIAQRFDLVGFDPRGVGESTQLKCEPAAAEDAWFSQDFDPRTQADFDAAVAVARQLDAPCAPEYGAQLPLFATEQSARDIDAVRVAVGDSKLTYLGFSYGTLLGATYAQLFPTHIRAMVLDGAVDPTEPFVTTQQDQAAGFELAFNDFAAWCKATPAQCPIGPDARQYVNTMLDEARTAPVTGADGRKATAGWVLTAVVQALYNEQYWPLLARGLANARAGNTTILFALADSYADRASDGTYSDLFDVYNAVTCTDYPDQPTVAQIRQLQLQWRTRYPLFGASLALGLLPCAKGIWPGAGDPFPTGQAAGAPPILVVGTVNDPATPYAGTAKLASMLGVGHVLTWDGDGHTAYPKTRCIDDDVDAYLLNLAMPPAGTVCPAG